MNAQAAPSPQPEARHPAPARNAVKAVALTFGICAAPLAWLGAHLGDYLLSGHLCIPMSNMNASGMSNAALLPFLILMAIMFLVALAGLVVSFINWRKTRWEHGGAEDRLIDVGEGRTRFLAMCGLIVSAAFLCLFVFTAVPMFAAPLCVR